MPVGERTNLATASEVVERTSEPPTLRPLARLGELWAAREVLANFIRKEVKVKYKSSALGAAWSMLNPILYLVVFGIVFTVFLTADVPDFAVYLLSGLLPWGLFSTSVMLGARSIVDNGNLVTKVYFPREMLPFASIGAAAVDFGLQAVVLVVFIVALQHPFVGANLLLLPLAALALLGFTAALTLWVASLNVRYRDTQHLLSLALLAWFWLTPIVYPSGFVYDKLAGHDVLGVPLLGVYMVNPMATIVMAFQRALYATVAPSPGDTPVLFPVGVGWLALVLTAVIAGSLVLLLLAWRTFFHLSGDFAEEL